MFRAKVKCLPISHVSFEGSQEYELVNCIEAARIKGFGLHTQLI